MLWYKNWLETRWRFAIGLALLICSAAASVLSYPQVVKLLPLASSMDFGNGDLARKVAEALELSRTFEGYVWSHWVRQNLINLWTVFAVFLGAGGLLSRKTMGDAAFTLSLPISRERLLMTKTAIGFAQLFVLAMVPSLLVPVLASAIGYRYGIGDTLVYGLCVLIAGAVFHCATIWLSTVFTDTWRPMLIVLGFALAAGVLEGLAQTTGSLGAGIFYVMGGGSYFKDSALPWVGLVLSALASAGFLFVASRNLSRRDF